MRPKIQIIREAGVIRNDIAKVIVERPRQGGHGARKGRALRDLEVARNTVGMKRAASESGDRKMLNENLAPLRRYFGRQVGRPWNHVWSEVCANLRDTSTAQQLVRDHISDFVAHEGVSRRDGQVYVHSYLGGKRPLKNSLFEFWVDPATGILRRNKRQQTYRMKQKARQAAWIAEPRKRMVERDAWHQFHLLDDGAWWEVSLEQEPPKPPVVDLVLSAGLSALSPGRLYGRSGVYAVGKRQLSKKEIKRLKPPHWSRA